MEAAAQEDAEDAAQEAEVPHRPRSKTPRRRRTEPEMQEAEAGVGAETEEAEAEEDDHWEPQDDLHRALYDHFGFKEFRNHQHEVIIPALLAHAYPYP